MIVDELFYRSSVIIGNIVNKMRFKYRALPIRWKLLIPLIISTLFLFIISQAIIHQSLSKSISKNLDDNLRQSTVLTHDLIENSVRESLRNYLRGRVEDSLYSIQSIYAAAEQNAICRTEGCNII